MRNDASWSSGGLKSIRSFISRLYRSAGGLPDNANIARAPQGLEAFEPRVMMTADNVFAQFSGSIAPGGQATINLNIRPEDFALRGGNATIGFLVKPAAGSTLDPAALTIRRGATAVPAVASLNDAGGQVRSVTIADLQSGAHTLTITGQGGTGGAFEVDVYLPGDANADRAVTQSDANTMRAQYGKGAGQPGYTESIDANYDGVINAFDQSMLFRNLTESTNVRPLASSALNYSPTPRTVLPDGTSYVNTRTPQVVGVATPGATISVDIDNNGSFEFNGTANAQGNFSVPITLPEGPSPVRVRIADAFGQTRDRSLAVIVDTVAPATPVWNLAPESDTDPLGDNRTTRRAVSLVGTTEPGAFVQIAPNGLSTTANAQGAFRLDGVLLNAGDNAITIVATDLAGNTSNFQRTITRTVPNDAAQPVLQWNLQMLESIRLNGDAPPMASRSMAMVSAAVYDAVNSVNGASSFLLARVPAPNGASAPAAAMAAAHRVLSSLYAAQVPALDALLAQTLATIPAGQSRTDGVAVGQAIADIVIALRANDSAYDYDVYTSGTAPGQWRETGPGYQPALLPNFARVTPFAMTSPSQFLPSGPPSLTSAQYAQEYNEVKEIGRSDSTTRTAEQTQIARFWADGAGTYTPAGHWNQIAASLAQGSSLSLFDTARLFAQLNVALGDAAIVAWNAKYTYNQWRPFTAIREAANDGNPATSPDSEWYSLVNTPPFPDYLSGHSTYSGAAQRVLEATFGTNTGFSSQSYGLPGVTRTFANFQQAAEEASTSRVYGGIHFRSSCDDGLTAGRSLGDYVLQRFTDLRDQAAPVISVLTPTVDQATRTNVIATGRVIDGLNNVASLEARLDNGNFAPLSFDSQGRFSLPITLALDGSADGVHTVSFRATDTVGNVSSIVARTFVLDTVAPALAVSSPASGSNLNPGARLVGTVAGTGSGVASLTYNIDGGSSRPVLFETSSGRFDQAIDFGAAAPGAHTLNLTTTDAAGNTRSTSIPFTLLQRAPLTITEVTPRNNANEAGLTQRPKVVFSRAIDVSSLNANNLYLTVGSQRVPTTIVPGADGTFTWLYPTQPMPGDSRVELVVDGSTIRAADGTLLDADGDGNPGGLFRSSFNTVGTSVVAGTTLSGVIADPGADLRAETFDDVRAGPDGRLMTADDIYLNPIAGVELYILGRESQRVFTDAQGRFTFTNIPAGKVKLVINGRTATNPPAGKYFPEMVMDLTLDPGITNNIMDAMRMDPTEPRSGAIGAYLPRIDSSILQTINSGPGTTTLNVSPVASPNLSNEQRSMLRLEVANGSLLGENGQPLNTAQIGISTVPPELVMDMLPAGVMQHTFDITIQAPNVANFSSPAALTFPNVFNAAPGTKLNFLSFNHTTGRLEIEGTATVSADGLSVRTDPGTGVTQPGWHGLAPPGPTGGGDRPRGPAPGPGPGPGPGPNPPPPPPPPPTWWFGPNPPPPPPPGGGVIVFPNPGSIPGGITFPGGGGVPPSGPGPGGGPGGSWIIVLCLPGQAPQYVGRSDDFGRFAVPIPPNTNWTIKVFDPNSGLIWTVSGNGGDGQSINLGAPNFQPPMGPDTDGDGLPDDVDDALNGSLFFDFGTGGSPLALNYRRVTDTTNYSAGQGFGWTSGTRIAVDRASFPGIGALRRDFNESQDATFVVDLQPGVYEVSLLLGDAAAARPGMNVFFEGERREVSSTTSGGFSATTHLVTVVDGQLTVRIKSAEGSSTAVALDALEIRRVGAAAAQASNGYVDLTGRMYFAIQNVDTGFVFRGVTVANGALCPDGVNLAPNTRYRQYVVDPVTFYTGFSEFVTPPSGVDFEMPVIIMGQARFADSDGDGLSDDAEFAVGSSASNADTDRDGVRDGAEVRNGTNPLDDVGFPTGVIGSLQLQGQANEIVVEGSTIDPRSQTAYIATGTFGLAIVDASQFRRPVILSEIDLSGEATDVGVDSVLRLAAVASGTALHIVNVANPASPSLVRTINANATSVEVVDGIAYAAVNGELRSYDMLTGELLDTAALGTTAISWVARDGQNLYTLDRAGVVRAVSINGLLLQPRGSANLSLNTSGKLFVGNGVAYASGYTNSNSQGFATVNIANPDSLAVISGVDANNIVSRGLAATGSGLLVSVAEFFGPGGGVNALDVSDVSNPSDTGRFLTRINLPAGSNREPAGLAIANGVALVATRSGGLQIVNFRDFETGTVAPTITFDPTTLDTNPGQPGIQVLEGSTLNLRATVADDVQVRNVEVLVNGNVVRNDVSFPFDLSAPMPLRSSGATTATIQIRVTDTGGNVALTPLATLELTPDTVAPTIVSINPPEGGVRGTQFRAINIAFSEPLDAASANPAAFSLTGPGGTLAPTTVQLRAGGARLQATFPALTPGTWTLSIDRSLLRDRAGNVMGTGTATSTFTIAQYTAVWVGASGGFWDVAANWDTGVVPGPTDDVLINAPGGAVVFRQGTADVRSLNVASSLRITGGSLRVRNLMQVDGTLSMEGGQLDGATLSLANPANLTFTSNGSNRFNGVTVLGDLNMAGTGGPVLLVTNGLTVTGAVRITANNATLGFLGTQAIQTSLIDVTGNNSWVSIEGNSTLTVGLGSTIRLTGDNARLGQARFFGGTYTLLNRGIIELGARAGQNAYISPSILQNQGSIQVTSGIANLSGVTGNVGDLQAFGTGLTINLDGSNYVVDQQPTISTGTTWTLSGSWSAPASFFVDGGTLNLGGTYTTDGLGLSNFVRNGGAVNLTGTLTNTGRTIAFNATTGVWNLAGGTIRGGVLDFTDQAFALTYANNSSNAFDGVGVLGDLVMAANSSVLGVLNGLTISGDVRITGNGSTFAFRNTQAFAGNLIEAIGNDVWVTIEGTSTLTIDPVTTIRLTGNNSRLGQARFFGGTYTLINQGFIELGAVNGQTAFISPTILQNQGSIAVTRGNADLSGLSGNVNDLQMVGPSSTVTLNGTNYIINQQITIPAGNTLNMNGSWSAPASFFVDGGTLNLGGTFTTAQLGLSNFLRNGGTVNITGTLDNTGSTLTFNPTIGTWTLLGGTVRGGTIAFVGGAGMLFANNSSNAFDGVTVSSDLILGNANSVLGILNGITVNGTIRITGNGSTLAFRGTQTFVGTIEATANDVWVTIEGTSTLTLAPSTVLRLGGNNSRLGQARFFGGTYTLINDGLIELNPAAGQTVYISPSIFTNNGMLRALGAGTHNLQIGFTNASTGQIEINAGTMTLGTGTTPWSNAGTITMNNATINFDGLFTTAGLGVFTRTGGVVNLTGTLNNTDSTFTLNSTTGSWNLVGGTLRGGTLVQTGGAGFVFANSSNNTFDGVTVQGDLALANASSVLTVLNGLTVNGVVRITGNDSTFGFRNTQTFTGTIEATGNNVWVTIEGTSTLTLAPTTLLRLSGLSSRLGQARFFGGTYTLINNGAIEFNPAAGSTYFVSPSFFTNNGTIDMLGAGSLEIRTNFTNASGATLTSTSGTLTIGTSTTPWSNAGNFIFSSTIVNLDGTFTTAGLGAYSRTGGAINLVGTLDNTGATLTLNSSTGSWNLAGGTLRGGTLVQTGGAAFTFSNSSSNIFDGVTVTGDLTLGNASSVLTVLNGITVSGTIQITGNDSTFAFRNTQTFAGSINATGTNVWITIEGTSTLTLAPSATIRLAANGQRLGQARFFGGTYTLINNGVIEGAVSTAGQTATISPSTFTNNGQLRQTGLGTLTVTNNWSSPGTILVSAGIFVFDGTFAGAGMGQLTQTGGGVQIAGVFINTGNTITLNSTTGSWTVAGGTIRNGTFVFTQGQKLTFTNSTSNRLDGVTITGDLVIDTNSAFVSVQNGLTISGAVRVTANDATFGFFGTQTFAGSLIEAVGTNSWITIEGTSTLTLSAGTTVRLIGSTSRLGQARAFGGTYTLINNGIIEGAVATAGQTTSVNPNTFTNNGQLRQTTPGTLSITATNWTSPGTITVSDGVFNIDGTLTTSAGLGQVTRTGAGTINITGTVVNTGNTITLNATTGSWTVASGTIRNGTIVFTAGQTLNFTNSSSNRLDGVTITGDLVLASNNAWVGIQNGLTISGVVRLTGNDTTLGFVGTQTFGGSLVEAVGQNAWVSIEGTSTLTIGASSTIRLMGTGSRLGQARSIGGTYTLINNGTIEGNGAANAQYSVQPTNFTNNGTLQSLAGSLTVNANWTSPGTLRSTDGQLLLDGTLTATGGLGPIIDAGSGSIAVTGTLINTGNTITLNSTTGDLTVAGGTIRGGTIIFSGSTLLFNNSTNNRLDGVSITGDLVLGVTGNWVGIQNGLTISGAIRLTAQDSTLGFFGTQTFAGSLIEATGTNAWVSIEGTGTLTIGPSTTIRLTGNNSRLGQARSFGGTYTLVNNGTLEVNTPAAQSTTISPTNFSNNGNVNVLASATLNFNTAFQASTGNLTIAAGGLVNNNGAMALPAGMTTTIDISGTTNTQFGRIASTGAVTFAGTLRPRFVSFTPSAGNTFTFFSYSSRTGTYGAVTPVNLPGGLTLTPNYNATNLTLSIT